MPTFIDYSKFELLVDLKDVQKGLRKAGTVVRKNAQALILAPASGKKYGKHRASAPGNAPASLKGVLASSFKTSMKKNAVTIKDTAPHATLLELGTRDRVTKTGKSRGKMEARPYLSLALANTDVQGILTAKLENIIEKRTTFK